MNVRKFYNKTTEIYDYRHNSPSTVIIRKKEKELIDKFVKGKTIDIGCGTGYHLDSGKDIIGIDISEGMLKLTLKKDRNILQARSERLPFKDSIFDTIFCFLAVLNMCDYEKTVKEFKRIIKPNGLALISIATVQDKKTGWTSKTMRIYKHRLHLHLFTKKEITDLFRKNGFELIYFDSLFILQQQKWGNLTSFTLFEKTKLFLDKFMPKEKGSMYFMVFKKVRKNYFSFHQ